MSEEDEWQKQIKEAEEQAAKTEQMRQNLQNSGDERNLKVEKEVPVFGDETQYKLTDNTGARTEIHIKDSGKVEARGEQTELADNVEKGEKVRPQSARPEAQSEVRRQAYQAIDASVLTEAEKTELKQRVENYNFAEAKEKPEEMVESLKTAVGRQENKEQEDAEKIQQYRGVSNKKKQAVSENSARTTNKNLTAALTAEALKDLANKGR
ncbi:MAG: hypothetical protein J6L86_05365 [Alphaproteobacteria bacterium]|nr:hypothetical protein [Alphaproteobacteria bacterium]MBQ8631910.1 hypothetical protein [Alphaproteobacteria bacterium]